MLFFVAITKVLKHTILRPKTNGAANSVCKILFLFSHITPGRESKIEASSPTEKENVFFLLAGEKEGSAGCSLSQPTPTIVLPNKSREMNLKKKIQRDKENDKKVQGQCFVD
jgi:hypothetical protein